MENLFVAIRTDPNQDGLPVYFSATRMVQLAPVVEYVENTMPG
jgi:hypothetical protein